MAPAAAGRDIQEEQVLQAVVLADSGQDYELPISETVPKALVPLVNTPLLDYTLDWLERCGVDEVIVYCRAQPHAEQIRQHCRAFETRRQKKSPQISVVASEDCHSMGDAMRDLYSKSRLKENFILIYGDVVSNVDLRELMAKHKERRAADKSAIMSCVYMNKDVKCQEEAALLILNAANNKLLHHTRPHSSTKLPIPTELFQGCQQLKVLPAVQDPGIAMCSEIVASLFSDNFDYGTRDSLLRGVIEQEELLGYSIFCEILDSGYSARASSLTLYEEVSSEVVCRLAYPMVPEHSLTSHRIRYNFDSFTSNYWEPSAKFHKSSCGTGVVVGAGSEVNMTAQLRNTIVGDHCSIHDKVVADSAFIMNNVTVKSGCNIKQCFLSDNVILEENVKLSPGCILGAGVVLGPDITVPVATCLMANPPPDDFDDSASKRAPDPLVCGAKGRAFVYHREDEEEEEESRARIWGRKNICDEEEEEEMDDDEEDMDEDSDEGMIDAMYMKDEDEQREHEFKREVTESLNNALREKSAAENVVLEINASRHAYNMSMEEVLETVTRGIVQVGEEKTGADANAESLWRGIRTAIETLQNVLRNYVRKNRDQLIVLNALEQMLVESEKYIAVIQKILYELNHTHEILDEEVILHWYKRGGANTPAFPKLQKAIARFIEWLEEEDESDEDDDSD
ncbi:translation initiation factor eIF2B subunit epsilon-like [Penaeus indicus]|uniref:translation initiation factor eIF2B subunit epsilon-like n=1 Tax=Penaeus indicus TaxID=29960 RepID=UPI00300D9627